MTQAQFDKFNELATQLSPEWLTCDGELSNAQVNARRRSIMKEWAALENEFGIEVTPDEVETASFSKYFGDEVNIETLGKKKAVYAPSTGKWKRFKGESLNEAAMKFLEEKSPNYMSGWCEAWYRGDVETTRDWFIVTPDGSYYKVDAEYMTWHRCETGAIVGMCNWSLGSLYKSRVAYFKEGNMPRDPNYQT